MHTIQLASFEAELTPPPATPGVEVQILAIYTVLKLPGVNIFAKDVCWCRLEKSFNTRTIQRLASNFKRSSAEGSSLCIQFVPICESLIFCIFSALEALLSAV